MHCNSLTSPTHFKVEALWFGCYGAGYGVIIWFLSGKNESEGFLLYSLSDFIYFFFFALFVCAIFSVRFTQIYYHVTKELCAWLIKRNKPDKKKNKLEILQYQIAYEYRTLVPQPLCLKNLYFLFVFFIAYEIALSLFHTKHVFLQLPENRATQSCTSTRKLTKNQQKHGYCYHHVLLFCVRDKLSYTYLLAHTLTRTELTDNVEPICSYMSMYTGTKHRCTWYSDLAYVTTNKKIGLKCLKIFLSVPAQARNIISLCTSLTSPWSMSLK